MTEMCRYISGAVHPRRPRTSCGIGRCGPGQRRVLRARRFEVRIRIGEGALGAPLPALVINIRVAAPRPLSLCCRGAAEVGRRRSVGGIGGGSALAAAGSTPEHRPPGEDQREPPPRTPILRRLTSRSCRSSPSAEGAANDCAPSSQTLHPTALRRSRGGAAGSRSRPVGPRRRRPPGPLRRAAPRPRSGSCRS